MLDFPNTPTLNQSFVGQGGVVYIWDGTKWVASTSGLSGGPYAPLSALGVGRNFVQNSLFNVFQRGTGPFAGGVVNADRWWTWIGSGDAVNTVINGASDAIRAGIGDEACQYAPYITFTGAAGAANLVLFQQNIESVRRLSGKTVTVSFWAQGAAGQKVGVSIDQNFGSGGSPSANVTGAGQAVTITAAWVRYALIFSIPSAAGKTLGTAGNMSQLNIWLSAGSNYATASGGVGVQSGGVSFWGVQLEVGNVATPLEKIDPRMDLANCQRFYQTFAMSLAAVATAAGQTFGYNVVLPVTMRATPAAAAVSNSSSNLGAITFYPAPGTLAAVAASSAAGGININVTASVSADL